MLLKHLALVFKPVSESKPVKNMNEWNFYYRNGFIYPVMQPVGSGPHSHGAEVELAKGEFEMKVEKYAFYRVNGGNWFAYSGIRVDTVVVDDVEITMVNPSLAVKGGRYLDKNLRLVKESGGYLVTLGAVNDTTNSSRTV